MWYGTIPPEQRHNLAVIEMKNRRPERAVKHFIIADNLGYDRSMKELWKCYAEGYVIKDDLTTTLLHIRLLLMQQRVHRERQKKLLEGVKKEKLNSLDFSIH